MLALQDSDLVAVACLAGGLELVVDLIPFLFQCCALLVVIAILVRVWEFLDHGFYCWLNRAGEDAVKRIVILRRDRVELVIVTARAGDGQAEKAFRHHVNPVVDHVLLHSHEAFTHGEKAKCGEIRGIGFRGGQFIRRELFDDEDVVRLIVVEAPDDVIAIRPRIRTARVFALAAYHAFRVAVTRHVEPVAAPAFAVVRRCEQTIHHFGERVRRLVFDERLDFLRRGRKPNQVKRRTTDQRAFISDGIGREIFRLQFREDEIIHGRFAPSRILHFGRSGLGQRLPCPMLLVRINPLFLGFSRGARIGRAHHHPFFQVGDLLISELLLGRHLQILVCVAHGFDQ